jgi:hypothetical protein
MVVWEGSHEVMRAAFAEAFAGAPPQDWPQIDITDRYHAARRACFDALPRLELTADVGESYLVHRLALHGVAPWRGPEDAPPRVVAYFRPAPEPAAAPDWALAAP